MRTYLLQTTAFHGGGYGHGRRPAHGFGTGLLDRSARPGERLESGYDKSRTGVNAAETILTPANVNSSANQFHKQFVMRVDGKIEGSPLYASGVAIAGGTHNVVYVATMHNTVFAFDADTARSSQRDGWGIRSPGPT